MKDKIAQLIVLLVLIFINPFQGTASGNYKKINSNDSLEVLHYDISLDTFDFGKKAIRGVTEIQIKPKFDKVVLLRFDLLKFSIDSIKLRIKNFEFRITNYSYNDTVIEIPYLIKDTTSIKIYYHGITRLDPSAWGGFYFTGNYAFNLGVGFKDEPHSIGRYWFPCIDNFNSKSLYDFHIRTKTKHSAVCNGTLVRTDEADNGTNTYHWKMNNRIPAYLASVAVSAYTAVRDTFSGMTGKVPISIYVNTANTSISNTKASFKNLTKILSSFENDFGAYRFERVGYVGVPFNNGAMEHATSIAIPYICIDGTLNYEGLFAHELSHHWFGDLITCQTEGDMWINEGWASYCESISKEGVYGRQSYKDNVRANHKQVLQFVYKRDNGYRALYGVPQDYTYCPTVYNKGADVVHTMRGYLGDSIFFGTVKSMLNDYAVKNISTAEMRDYMSLKTGRKMNDFFNCWVYGKGFPHYSLDTFMVLPLSMPPVYSVEVDIRQRLKEMDAFAKSNIIEVTFMDKSWKQFTDTIVATGEKTKKIFDVPFKPDFVMLDINEKVSDATTDNYKTINKAGIYSFNDTYFTLNVTTLTDSMFIRAEHNWIAPEAPKATNIVRLSDMRYWKIDGIMSSGNTYTGMFYYNRLTDYSSGWLDNKLLPKAASVDSLVLLYRKNKSEAWRIIDFTINKGAAGYITTTKPQAGEYCLGISGTNSIAKTDKNEAGVKIYPNPSDKSFHIEIEFNTATKILFYNMEGALIDTINVNKAEKQFNWTPKDKKPAIYLMKIMDANGITLNARILNYVK